MKVRFYLSYRIKITLKSLFWRKKLKFCHYVRNVVMDVITFPENQLTTSGLSILMHGVISLPGSTSYDRILFFKYLHFQSKPIMNLQIFAAVQNLMHNRNIVDS